MIWSKISIDSEYYPRNNFRGVNIKTQL